MSAVGLYPGAASIAIILGGHGYRKGSLSADGAIAAFLVGYGHLANPLKLFGSSMIFFYLLGSRATKVKADVKARLEDGVDSSKGGNRNAIQVLSNSIPSLVAALIFRFAESTSNIDLTRDSILVPRLSRGLIFLALGSLFPSFTGAQDITAVALQLDSILGAYCQQTSEDTTTGKILTDNSDAMLRSSAGIRRVGVGRDWLSNSGVNFVCGVVMGGVGWWWGSR